MIIEPEISAASVVLLGEFTPQIFQPHWFVKHGLLPDEAAENAEISVINPYICAFGIETFFTLHVEREGFTTARSVAPLILMSDVVVRLFGDLLPHTPIRAMGINRLVHFDAGTAEKRDRIGDLLAPKAPWGQWGKKLSSGDPNKHGGMLSLTMVQFDLSDRAKGSILAKIEPSTKIGSGKTGIFMEINDHYQTDNDKDAEQAVKILQERFDDSLRNSDTIINQIMSLTNA
jgi:hypothetical protein